MNTLTTIYTTW